MAWPGKDDCLVSSHQLARVGPRYSVVIVGLIAITLSSALDIKTVAQLADLAVFAAYLFVNASLIMLASAKLERKFQSPRIVGVPVIAWLGLLYR